jgi:hypothetical protein
MRSSASIRQLVVFAAVGPLAAALAGCGSGPVGHRDAGPDQLDAGDPNALSCDHRSGSRIRRVMRQHEDGTSEFLHLHDSEIGETCQFRAAGDGSLRCVPVADGTPVAPGQVRYIDAGCSVRLARLGTAVQDPPATILQQQVPSDDRCSNRVNHYLLGNQVGVEPGVTTIYTSDGVNCTAVLADGNPYFEIIGDLAPSQLVGGEESWVGGRLRMRQIDGEDGSRWCDVTGDLRDADLDDHLCSIGFGEDGEYRCQPRTRAVRTVYGDDACMNELSVSVTAVECDSGYQFTDEIAGSCRERRVRARGSEVNDLIYTMTASGCQLDPLAEGQRVYRVGPAVSGTSFSAFTRTYLGSGGRLERGDLAADGGLRLFRSIWRDTELDGPCQFAEAADGVPRCLPAAARERAVASVMVRYADESCMTQVRVAIADPCHPGVPALALESGSGVARVYPIAGQAAGPLYELSGGCLPIADLTGYFSVGAEIAPTTFVAGEEVTE